MINRKINTPLKHTFCSMKIFLQLDIILPIVYNNNKRIGWNYMVSEKWLNSGDMNGPLFL